MGQSILIPLVAVAAFQVIWMTYEKLSYKKGTPYSHDRVMIKPGPMSWVLCTVFCISLGIMTIGSVATNDDVLYWLVLGPPLTAIMGLGAYGFLLDTIAGYRCLCRISRFEWMEAK